MNSIKDLLIDSNSDKQSGHRYGFIYDLLFNYVLMRKNKPLKILEIGVSEYGDGSLKSYARSDIVELAVGIDLREYTGEMLDNMKFYQVDAYTEKTIDFLEDKYGMFDIIIDDGSHSYEHQTFFLDKYIDLIHDNGLLICEDVNLLQVINEQCARDDIFFFDGWGNLELNAPSFTDPKVFQHNERIIVKAKSMLTDFAKHKDKPHIEKLPVRKFRDYKRNSTELAISVPLYHPDFPDENKYNAENFREIHCRGAIWAAMSMIHNSDLGDRGTPIYFHIEDKVWDDAMPVFSDFNVPEDWLRKMTVPPPTRTLTADKAQFGKSLMSLIDTEIDADVTMILDSDLFTCSTGNKLQLYDKFTSPILKRQPAMTYFQRRDLVYWWWVSVVMGSAPLPVELYGQKPLNEIEKLGYETLGFEKELETCAPDASVNRFFADEYIKTFPRQHPARDFAIEIMPHCYTPCYAFSMWAEFNHPIVELDTLLNVPTYDWERDFLAAQKGLDCFAHIRVERGRGPKFTMPSILNQYWDVFWQNVSRYV